jgi:glycosyltransferase involved in cell wall biosynthesis
MTAPRKPKVLFEAYMIPHYRIPFYSRLAQKVNLTVIASRDKTYKTDGINDVRESLPFKTIRLKADPASGLFHPEIVELIRQDPPDIIISWTNSFRLLLNHPITTALIHNHGIKTIWQGCDGYSIHNFLIGSLANFLPWRLKNTWTDIRTMAKIDHFVAHSSHVEKFLKRVRYVPASKITLTHNAIDTSEISELYRRWSQAGEPRKPNGLVFISRLIPGKQIEKLIAAFAIVTKKHPQATLTIIGEGSYETTLRAQVYSLGITDRVIFAGGIYDDGELAKKLYANSLFVLPGVGGLSFNTAMAAGLPIIHTHADGTEEDLIREGYNGWFFHGSAEALARVINRALSDPNQLKIMGARSENLITNIFNLDLMVEDYLNVISSLQD